MNSIPKILMVDDDDDDKLLMKSAFEDNQYPVEFEFANSGEELINKLKSNKSKSIENPSIIILDLNMPKISGHDVLKFLKADAYFDKIPVIIFSTSRNEKDKIFAMNMGANDYIIKPSSYAQLLDVVKEIHLFCLSLFGSASIRTS